MTKERKMDSRFPRFREDGNDKIEELNSRFHGNDKRIAGNNKYMNWIPVFTGMTNKRKNWMPVFTGMTNKRKKWIPVFPAFSWIRMRK